jgi:hypothetical protein
VMTLQTGSDVKFQPRLIEGIRLDGEAHTRRAATACFAISGTDAAAHESERGTKK